MNPLMAPTMITTGLGVGNVKQPTKKSTNSSGEWFVPAIADAESFIKNLENTVKEGLGKLSNTPTVSPSQIAASQQSSRVANLRNQIRGNAGTIEDIYNALFGDLDALVNSRRGEIDRLAGKSIEDLTQKYVSSIPGIESSYAALGAGDSTDNTYAKVDAKAGFEKAADEVGEQKNKDLTALGLYDQETKAGFNADRDALRRIISRLDETENEGDLADARNTIENKIDSARANRASLKTDGALRGDLNNATSGLSTRADSIKSSLDAILNSSLSGTTKEAARQAVTNSAGLTDEEKNQLTANRGY